MSRRGNCYDNAVAESFFSNLKKERVKRKTHPTREEAKSDIFAYIEVFHSIDGGAWHRSTFWVRTDSLAKGLAIAKFKRDNQKQYL